MQGVGSPTAAGGNIKRFCFNFDKLIEKQSKEKTYFFHLTARFFL